MSHRTNNEQILSNIHDLRILIIVISQNYLILTLNRINLFDIL